MNFDKNAIIQYIKENKMSTEEVADCLQKTGLLEGAKPIRKGLHCVGEIEYVYGFNDSNWSIHEQIRSVGPGKILFVDDINVGQRALFGQLVSRYILQQRKELAVITKGYMRDINGLLDDKANIWCKGITPLGCFNKKEELNDKTRTIIKENMEFFDGAIAVCDDSGVIVIPKEKHNEEFFKQLEFMVNQEKIWFECVDEKGWDTYDTVCLKKYL